MTFAVEAIGGNSGTNSIRTLSFTVTSANLLMVGVGIGDGSGLATITTGVTFNSVAMTAVSGSDSTGSGPWSACRWYRLNNPSVGTFDISVGCAGAQQSSVHAISFIDADIGGTAVGTPDVANGTTSDPSVTVADSASGNVVVSLLVDDNEAVDTAGTSGTTILDAEVGGDTDHCSQYQTASGSNSLVTFDNNGSGSDWALSALAVKGVGGSPLELMAQASF